MSDVYSAQIDPSKPEAVARQLSTRLDTEVSAEDLTMLSSFRFDDPAGEVGCETHLVRVRRQDGTETVLQVPLTYRGAPLVGAPESALVTKMDHSVLGDRWIYDGAHDPVYAAELLLAITDAGSGAVQYRVGEDGSRTQITEGLANVRGTGAVADPADPSAAEAPVASATPAADPESPVVERTADRTVIRLRGAAVEVADVLDTEAADGEAVDGGQLVATWAGQETPVVLAQLVR